ncbi:hypothetical protein JCM19239_3912 [Vibrio variabilis]|uniref:Uncharacterized protein n=1 Tax=Vibrio variabilis TaxID=990271 RepID=A0ABQ0J615_9VIBR|nr:hypothetical protein JCM19239_3912 [Vibrio variabilis]
MVFNAGKYRLVDFIKVGIPVSLAYGLTAIVGIVMVYKL